MILIKLKYLLEELTGLNLPILETVANHGVLHTIGSILFMSIVRFLYKGFNLLGRILLWPKRIPEKQELQPIGERTLLRDSVATIAKKIRQRQVSAEFVLRTFINRVQEVNKITNCMVDERFELALEEAKYVDTLISSGEFDEVELRDRFPLLGVPFTIKDSFSVKGLRHTAGLYHRKDIISDEDADVVKILRNSGAIILGVTNVSELCMWWESVNTIYGRSSNPYDSRHITGGSSGGEASLQGAAGSAFGIGSDIGGSIRMPAFFCGVFGHKPTVGLIPNHGQKPDTVGRIAEFLTTGPIVRHAQDLSLLFNIMTGDNLAKVNPVPDLKQIRVFYMEDDGGSPMASPINNEMRKCMEKTVSHLEKRCGKVQKVNIQKLYNSLEIWASGMSGAGAPTFCQELAMKDGEINPFLELLKYPIGLSHHTFSALILGILEKVAYRLKGTNRHKDMINMGYDLAKDLQDLLQQDAVLLYPTHPSSAPKHNEPLFRPGDFSYTAIFNVLGVPVTQVPLGLGENVLPTGIQVVGGLFSDLLTIRIAEVIEEEFGGWVEPGLNRKSLCGSGSGNSTKIASQSYRGITC